MLSSFALGTLSHVRNLYKDLTVNLAHSACGFDRFAWKVNHLEKGCSGRVLGRIQQTNQEPYAGPRV